MMKELIEEMAKALVDKPEEVKVRAVEGQQVTVFELRADRTDVGKIIGKQGRTVNAIRTIMGAVATKLNKRYSLEVLE